MSRFNQIPREKPKQDFPVIPVGIKTFKIYDIVKQRKEGGDYSYYNVTLKIMSGDYKDRQVWDILSLSPKQFCQWRIKQFVEAWYGNSDNLDMEVGDSPEFDEFISKAKGKIIRAFIEHEPSI